MAPAPAPQIRAPGQTNVVVLSKIPEGITESQLAAGAGRPNEILQISLRPADLDGPGWAIIAFASPELAKVSRDRLDGKALINIPGVLPTALEAAMGEGLYGNIRGNDSDSPWKEARTPQGQVYYYHHITRQSVWTKPPPDFASPSGTSFATQSLANTRTNSALPPAAAMQAAQAAIKAAPSNAASTQPATSAPLAQQNLNAGPVGANLFIYHIPGIWDDCILRQHFEHFGKIVSCRVQCDNEGRPRGFGFVSFDSPTGAQAAIAGMHGFPVEGKHLKVQLKKGDEQQLGPAPTPLAPTSVPSMLDVSLPTVNVPPPPSVATARTVMPPPKPCPY